MRLAHFLPHALVVLLPRAGRLEERAGPHHRRIVVALADYLQADRPPVSTSPAGTDAAGWPVKFRWESQAPADQPVDWLAVDLGRTEGVAVGRRYRPADMPASA